MRAFSRGLPRISHRPAHHGTTGHRAGARQPPGHTGGPPRGGAWWGTGAGHGARAGTGRARTLLHRLPPCQCAAPAALCPAWRLPHRLVSPRTRRFPKLRYRRAQVSARSHPGRRRLPPPAARRSDAHVPPRPCAPSLPPAAPSCSPAAPRPRREAPSSQRLQIGPNRLILVMNREW